MSVVFYFIAFYSSPPSLSLSLSLSLSPSASLPLVTIAVFSSQGNNCPDAINMADHIDQWLNLKGNEEGEGNGEEVLKVLLYN